MANDGLASEAQAADQFLIAALVGLLQIVQQLAALVHHLEQPTTRMVVFLVAREVFGELIDPSRQQGNLDLGRARIGRIPTVLRDDFGLLGRFESHFNNPLGLPYPAASLFNLLVEGAHHTEIFGAAQTG